MTVPTDVTAAVPVPSVGPNIAKSAPTKLRCMSPNPSADSRLRTRPSASMPTLRCLIMGRLGTARSPADLSLRLFAPGFDNSHPVGGPDRRDDLQTSVPSHDRLLQPCRPVLIFPQPAKCVAQVHLRHRPVKRHSIACPFPQRRPIDLHRLLQTRRPTLTLAQGLERSAEIHLGHGPLERHPITCRFLQSRAKRCDRSLQTCRPAFALAQH